MLMFSKDSIQNLLDSVQDDYLSAKLNFRAKIDSLQNQINALEDNVHSQQNINADLEQKINKSAIQIQMKEQEIIKKENAIRTMELTVNSKDKLIEKHLATIDSTEVLLESMKCKNCVYDIDNNEYKTVVIKGSTWMQENLNVSHFRNGDEIWHAKSNEEWEKASQEGIPAWCYYLNDPYTAHLYGKLYNGFAVTDKRGLAPEGWEISTNGDFENIGVDILSNTGIEKLTYNIIKYTNEEWDDEAGGLGYSEEMRVGNNLYHFNLHVQNGRYESGDFDWSGGLWLYPNDEDISYLGDESLFYLQFEPQNVSENYTEKGTGMYVRCVKQ